MAAEPPAELTTEQERYLWKEIASAYEDNGGEDSSKYAEYTRTFIKVLDAIRGRLLEPPGPELREEAIREIERKDTAPMITLAYSQGYEARRLGRPQGDNRYKPSGDERELYLSWHSGWCDADDNDAR